MRILFLSDNFPPEGNAPAARLHEHARRWIGDGHQVTVISRDLQQPGAAQALMDDLAAHHLEVDTLVNNAGFGVSGNVTHADRGATSAMLQLNMITLAELTQRVLPGMVARGHGRIHNVATKVAIQPNP